MKKDLPKILLLIEGQGVGQPFIRGVARYARLYGPWDFNRFSPFYLREASMKREIDQMKNWGPDGIVMGDYSYVDDFLALGVPTIVFVANKDSVDKASATVVIDSEKIAKMAADYLLERGFKNFAFCGYKSASGFIWSQERKEMFTNILSQRGFHVYAHEQKIRDRKSFREKNQAMLIDWLVSLPKPIGLLACNDDCSQDVADACKVAGIDIPGEVAILGVDNDEFVCELSLTPLSSLELNYYNAGYESAKVLAQMMAGEKVGSERIAIEPIQVVTRTSTDVTVIENREVASAMSFIKSNARVAIRVDDVVDATCLSRRVLEKQFRNEVGRSIHEQIRRARTSRIIKMLAETELSIKEIARILDFPDTNHIARFFRKEKGVTLLEYRKNLLTK